MSISANFPTIRPSLLLDFADTRLLDPRITFTRASTATFYDQTSSALAEQNLLLYSQLVGGTNWSPNGATATTNNLAAPDGTTTASLITETVTTGSHDYYGSSQPASVVGTAYTYSCYMKAGTRTWGLIRVFQAASGVSTNRTAYFDLSGGALGIVDSPLVATITSAGSGWYRCTISYTAVYAGSLPNSNGMTSTNGTYSYTGDGTSGLYIWGAQLEQRSAVTAYTPTTTAAITNYIPVLQTAASGVARFDCNPVTRESLGLLIEESRTNLLTYSSGFDNAAWTKTASSITTVANIAPDGTQTAQLLVEDTTASSEHRIRESGIVKTASQVLTYSVNIKPAGRFTILAMEAGGSGLYTVFDVANNQYTDFSAAAGFTRGQTSITALGNGWYRCVISGTTDTSLSINVRINLSNTYPGVANQTYTGNGYSGVFIWGAQLEAGAFATSYIPTVASQGTRAADAASMTGTNFSSWNNIGSGSLYSEATSASTATAVIASFNGITAGVEEVNTRFPNSGGATGAIVRINNVNATFSDSTGVVGTFYKQAVSYQNNSQAYSRSGSLLTTSISGAPATLNSFTIGGRLITSTSPLNGAIKRIAYYPVAVTSTQLQALTS